MDATPSPKQPARDWSELPPDELYSVFAKLGTVEVLMGAGLVCRSWLQAAKVPVLWRSVDMEHHELIQKKNADVLCAMAKVAVDRSDGQMEVFVGDWFVTNNLLKYIADRSPSLKVLRLVSCYSRGSNEGFTKVIRKCPLLEDIVLIKCPSIGGNVYELIGEACALKRLELHNGRHWCFGRSREVVAMHGLRDLTLTGCDINDEELADIVDVCPCLEHLHVIACYRFFVDEALRAKCARIKTTTLMPYYTRKSIIG